MSWTAKTVFGLILLLIGANILLKMLGIHLGGLLGIIISVLIMGYGYSKMKSAEKPSSKYFGIAIVVFGGLLLLGQAHMFVGLLVAAMIIYFGYNLVKGDGEKEKKDEPLMEMNNAGSSQSFNIKDSFDEEWKNFLKKNNLN